jgi:hypothetical protein
LCQAATRSPADEAYGSFDFELNKSLLGRRLVERWELWRPSIEAIGGTCTYRMFERLVAKLRAADVTQ